MKKLVAGFVGVAALGAFSLAMAGGITSGMVSDNGFSDSNESSFFVSGNLGEDKVDAHHSDFNTINPNFPGHRWLTGFAWNVNLGYQFNRYFALETGYTHFHSAEEQIANTVSLNTLDTHLSGIDLVAKGILPLNDQLNLFAKAGGMILFNRQVLHITPQLPPTILPSTTTTHATHIVPEFGLGAAYNITHHVALTIQGITTLGKANSTKPATYAGYAGVSYKFNM